MNKSSVMAEIYRIGVLPVVRSASVQHALALAEAIADGGITVLEITMTVPGALEVLRSLARDRPDILLGAGTVLDPETARACILEGARFIVSPALNLATVELCHRYSIAVLPGALTPTEIVAAWQAGADAVKVFPASAMGGAPYLRSLKAPLPHIHLIPTGGVTLANAADFFDAGAYAVGAGADLADAKAMAAGRADLVTANAAKYLAIVQAARAMSAG